MTSILMDEYYKIVAKASDYHNKALWQEKLRVLQEGLIIVDEPGFPDADARQTLYYDLGGIWRRLGQYDRAEAILRRSLREFPDTSPLRRASILGELVVVLRHCNRFSDARAAADEQYHLAAHAGPGLDAAAELCRAIGNAGMISYNMSQQTQPTDAALLETAFAQLGERVQRARDLQHRIAVESPDSRHATIARSWETIGLDRLTLCYIAAGEYGKAVEIAEQTQLLQTGQDPTVAAFSKFFYGYALWNDGQRDRAVQQWNAPPGRCSLPMAFCKEPTKEHTEYVEIMASAGVDFDSYDEQGFSALDYAVLSDNPDARNMISIIIDTLRISLWRTAKEKSPHLPPRELEREVEHEVVIRKRQAQLRRQYRILLQEQVRPELRAGGTDLFHNLRRICANFISTGLHEQRVLTGFQYVKYNDFMKHGQLPRSTARLTNSLAADDVESEHAHEPSFVIFISYRWLGEDAPDNPSRVQWRRIANALHDFLRLNSHVAPETLGIWLDYACIDQEDAKERERGINALPLAVTLSNAMISLVDETYYDRAWCVVEVMLVRALRESYWLHQWWEHVLSSSDTDLLSGHLRTGDVDTEFDLTNLKLTKEKIDRPKIDFLMRQSKLLAKDNA